MLESAPAGATVVLAAPMGWGKTVAMEHYLACNVKKYRVAWVRLKRTDNHPMRFARKLCRSLARAGLHLRRKYAEREIEAGDLFDCLEAALHDRVPDAGPIALVLDDFDQITSESLIRCVADISRAGFLPLSLFILSTSAPVFVEAVATEDGCLVIGEDELAFTASEIASWTKSFGGGRSPDEIGALRWASKGRAIDIFCGCGAGGAVEELANRLPVLFDGETIRFLLQVSCLDSHPVRLCTFLCGMDAVRIFKRAARLTPLIARVGANEYVLHDILLQALRRVRGDDAAAREADVLLRAGGWYERWGMFCCAADAYGRAADWGRLARVLSRLIGGIQRITFDVDDCRSDEARLFAALIAPIPLAVLREGYPMLELCHLVFLFLSGQLNRGMEKMAEMRAFYESLLAGRENAILGELEVLRAGLAFQDVRSKDKVLMRASALLGGISVLAGSDLPITFGSNSILLTSYNEDRPLNDILADYIAYWRKHDVFMGGLMRGLETLALGEAAFLRCEYERAEAFAEETEAMATQASILMAANFLVARVHAFLGNYDGFADRLERAKQLVGRTGSPAVKNAYDYCLAYFASLMNAREFLPGWMLDELGSSRSLGERLGRLQYEGAYFAFWQAMSGDYESLACTLAQLRASLLPKNLQVALIYISLYESALHFVAGDKAGARERLMAAHRMTVREDIVVPFVELSRVLHPLVQEMAQNARLDRPPASFTAWLAEMDERMTQHNRAMLRLRRKGGLAGSVFSRRETEVRDMLGQGATRNEICEKLGVTRRNLSGIIFRLKARESAQLRP